MDPVADFDGNQISHCTNDLEIAEEGKMLTRSRDSLAAAIARAAWRVLQPSCPKQIAFNNTPSGSLD
jgi:hypothetical protein